ncbi:MAG: ATP-binding cassette domain-containing protein [Ignavibacteriales bacterium]|nr:ATP-binding cassette domain-containing protein [Ignavibacteriales bacterium]
MNYIIETENLTKKFGDFSAVDSVSLNVRKGEIYGFLGLNGAGKTTTIKMILGLISPSNGTIKVLNETIKSGGKGPWSKVGTIVEVPFSYPELSVIENLEIISKLRNLKNKSSETVIKKLKLTKYEKVKSKNLSLGNLQRLGLAKALIHNPELLILDEPSNGLDPEGIVEIRELLLDLSKNKCTTIFISSHILSEISKIADRIGIIHNGKLIKEISSQEFDNINKKSLLINTRNNELAMRILKEKNLNPIKTELGEIKLTDSYSLNNSDKIASELVLKGVPLLSQTFYEEDLEKYFLNIIHNPDGLN